MQRVVLFVLLVSIAGGCSQDQGANPGANTISSTTTTAVPRSGSAEIGVGVAAIEAAGPAIEPEPVVVAAQNGSRAQNNELAVVDWRSIDYSLVDEAAFFASTYAIKLSDDLMLPTDMVGYRWSQASLPSDETIAAVARAIGIDVPVQRHADIPDDPDFEPPSDFAYWEAFDSSTGQWLTAERNGVHEYGLPVLFSYQGPHPIVDGQYGEIGDAGPLCEFTENPVAGRIRSECPGDYAILVDEVTLPSAIEAEEIAAEIVTAAHPTVGKLRCDTTVTEEPTAVTVGVSPAARTSPLNWHFEFGADGNLRSAHGNVGTLDVVDTYPVVGLDEAIERLRDMDIRWLAPAGIVPQTEPHPPEPTRHDITIVDVEAALWSGASPHHFATAEYGYWYWLPAYAFVDSNGDRHVVPAVIDDLLMPPRG